MAEKQLPSSDEVIYSTYPEFEYEYANVQEEETLQPEEQNLVITLARRKIDGTPVTMISGFVGKRIDLIRIEQQLTEVCRTCGTTRMYDIILIRDVRKRAYIFLRNSGFGVQFALD
jgi:translation initiation factor 1